MVIYVVIESETERFIDAFKHEAQAKRLTRYLNSTKALKEQGLIYKYREHILL